MQQRICRAGKCAIVAIHGWSIYPTFRDLETFAENRFGSHFADKPLRTYQTETPNKCSQTCVDPLASNLAQGNVVITTTEGVRAFLLSFTLDEQWTSARQQTRNVLTREWHAGSISTYCWGTDIPPSPGLIRTLFRHFELAWCIPTDRRGYCGCECQSLGGLL